MTAINALATPHAAFMLTDTAIYYPDGEIVGFESKVTTIPHLRLAFATSGRPDQQYRVGKAMWGFASFDEVIDGAGARLKEAWDEGEFEQVRPHDLDHFRLVIVGWSDRMRRGAAYVMVTDEKLGLEPFKITDSGAASIQPAVHIDVLREAGLSTGDQPIVTGAVDWLGKLVDIQRSRACRPPGEVIHYEDVRDDDDAAYVVGGAAMITGVNQQGIMQEVIRRWPDRVGEKIVAPHAQEKERKCQAP